MKKGLSLLTAAVLLGCSSCGVIVEEHYPGMMQPQTEETELPEATPQDDFYRYVNEDTLADARFSYGAMTAAEGLDQQIVDDQLHELIDEIVAGSGYERGSEEYVIKNVYDQCMGYYEGSAPQEIEDLIAQIDSVSSIGEFMMTDAMLLKDFGVSSVLNYQAGGDVFIPGRNSLIFVQYSDILNVDFEQLSGNTYGLYAAQQTVKTAMMVAGYDPDEAEAIGTEAAYLVFDIQRGSGDLIMDDPDIYKYVTSCTAEDLRGIFTSFDLDEYMRALGLTDEQYAYAMVLDMEQLQTLNSILTDENLQALKAWKIAGVVQSYMQFLKDEYSNLMAGYYGESGGYNDEERAFSTVNMICSDLISPLYVERYYSAEEDEMLRSMCDDIKAEYRVLIAGADWLTQETRDGLLRKLDNITYLTGSDVSRGDPSGYMDLIGNSWYETYRNCTVGMIREQLESLGPVTDLTPGMPMQVVNACYIPSDNTITITVGIMNAPVFSVENDYYTNLGGLGMIIAHEMGHAFDSTCILFDENGLYDPGRIPQSDMQQLDERNAQAAAYFEDNFTVFGVYHVDGEQTLGENYADLGGMECVASIAARGTQQQREAFFENYARIWCEKVVDTAVVDQIAGDVHSPSVIRVNSILSTLDLFYETYGVSEGDGMYIAPENRISRWY